MKIYPKILVSKGMALSNAIMYSFYIIKIAQDKSRVKEVLFLHQIGKRKFRFPSKLELRKFK